MDEQVELPLNEQPMTVMGLDQLAEKYAEMRDEIDRDKDLIKVKQASLDSIERKLIEYLTEADKNSWDSKAGKIIIQTRYSVSMPKDSDERKKLFDYLKEKGQFDSLITINHQTLQGYAKSETEAALDEGNVDFKIPGLAEPVMNQYLQLRKGKN